MSRASARRRSLSTLALLLGALLALSGCDMAPDAALAIDPVEDPAAAPTAPAAAVPTAPAAAVPCATAPAGMSCIPGGEFVRGHDADPHDRCDQIGRRPRMKASDTRPQATITLGTFYMDQHEVTNADYKACIAAKACNRAAPKYQDYGADKQPVTGVSWHDAVKFCAAQGKHLPTEAQWEAAARGPKGELYPWGDSPKASCELAVIMDDRGRSCGEKKRRGKGSDKGRVLEVGSKPAGRYGLFDMIGNAEEWVHDWYSIDYEVCGEDCAGVDPGGPCGGEDRCDRRYKVVRGGSWYYPEEHATGLHRRPHGPDNKPFHHFGFRCAASAEEAAALASP